MVMIVLVFLFRKGLIKNPSGASDIPPYKWPVHEEKKITDVLESLLYYKIILDQ